MRLFPVHSIGILNLWLLMFVFSLPILITIYLGQHIFQATSSQFRSSRSSRAFRTFIVLKFYMLFYFIYSVFVPIEYGSPFVTAGLILYCAGFFFYSWAWIIIARAKGGAMFTKGPFRYSRHPVYLSSAVMFLGAGFISNSLFFLGLSLITGLSHMHNAYDEEKICRQVFGKDYEAYSEMTPRWIGLPGKENL